MPITATGLGSGLDVETLVAKLVLAEVAPLEQRIVAKEAQFQSKLSAFGLVKSALADFEASAGRAALVSNYTSKTSISSDITSVSVVANADAEVGSLSVEVLALAKAQVLASERFETAQSVIGTGTLTIQIGTTASDGGSPPNYTFTPKEGVDSVDVVIDENNQTLSGIRDAINAATSQVKASIINDGSGARLVLTSNSTGLENSINILVEEGSGNAADNIDQSGLSKISYLAGDASGRNLSEVEAAQDASITINNIAVTGSSNTFSEAVEGITLVASKETESTVFVSTSRNNQLATAAVEQFVNEYNELITSLSGLTAYNAELSRASTLTGDSTIRNLLESIRGEINRAIQFVDGDYASLADLGITTQTLDGTLSLDSSRLTAAINEDPLDVANVFARLGRPSNSAVKWISSTEATAGGDFAVSLTDQTTSGELTSGVIDTSGNNGNKRIIFSIEIDGESVALDLDTEDPLQVPSNSNNPSLDEIRSAIEAAINAGLTGGRAVVVSVATDEVGDQRFVFTSSSAGTESTVEITSVDAGDAATRFGLAVAAGTSGTSVTTAQINGLDATWDAESRRMTGAEGTDVEGLVLEIAANATGGLGSVKYGIGLGANLEALLNSYLKTGGLLEARTDGLDTSIEDLEAQRLALQNRANRLEEIYRQQFNGLETLISQLNATQNFLTTALSGFVEPLSFKK